MRSRYARFSPEWWQWMTEAEPNSGCWLWTGTVCASGYGRVARGSSVSKVHVHRIAYECAFGEFDRALKVCHRCDTPSCVNPDHLYLGTQKDNMREMFSKGRANPRGHRASRVELLRTVAAPKLASKNSNDNVVNSDILHHIRTTVMVARWRQVTGVPQKRPTNAVVLWKRPQAWTPEPSTSQTSGYADGVTPAPCWPQSPVGRFLSDLRKTAGESC